MNADRMKMEQFLLQINMHPDVVDMMSTVDDMMEDMKRGLNGKPASMEMLPTFIEVDSRIPLGEKVIVLDAGGTNLRAALVSFTPEGKSLIEDFTKCPMPGTCGKEASRDEFFNTMAALVNPLVNRGGKIGFCFSYPTEVFSDKDGRLLHWTKEVQASEVVGRKVGADLRDALSGQGVSNPPEVVILNDTVATLLAGKASHAGRSWGGYLGLILGTGTNTCYVESNVSFGKLPDLDLSRRQVVNCESGNFNYRHGGQADKKLCSLTERADFHVFEKMISGKYFGPLVTQTVLLAGEAGLFSNEAFDALKKLGEISTKDADNYAHNPSDTENPLVSLMKTKGSSSDIPRLWFLIDALLERAAKLTSANLAASVLKGVRGSGPLSPTCITIDGTTYYRYYRFQHRVESCCGGGAD